MQKTFENQIIPIKSWASVRLPNFFFKVTLNVALFVFYTLIGILFYCREGIFFNHSRIFTQQNWLKIKEWPLWKHLIDIPQEARKLFIDPNEGGSEKMNILSLSNKRLKKEIRKLKSEYEKLKEHIETKERQTFILKTIIKQHDAIKREIFDDKEVDLQTKEKYLEGIFHACCQRSDCEHAH